MGSHASRTGALSVEIAVTDPDVRSELESRAAGDERDMYARDALRVGVLALRAASGVVDCRSVQQAVQATLSAERDVMLGQFSLDNEDGALTRLLDEVRTSQGELTESLRGEVDTLLEQFTLDSPNSSLVRLKRELTSTIDQMTRRQVEFQASITGMIAALQVRRQELARSPRGGLVFEDDLAAVVEREAERAGDIFERTGTKVGVVANCRVGDLVVEMGEESAAPGSRIVIESKRDKSYDVARALAEIERARRNRTAQVGIFVMALSSAPPGVPPLTRHGTDILVRWDPDDASSDVFVTAALSVARALAIRVRTASSEEAASIEAIEHAVRAIEKQVARLAEIVTWAKTVRSNGEKIADAAATMQASLVEEIEALDEQVEVMRLDRG
jgi:hypothetical protein